MTASSQRPKIKIKYNTDLLNNIRREIKENGPNCDLNHFDVSELEDFSYGFFNTDFNGDITQWDTRNAKYFDHLFAESMFNKPIYFNTENAISFRAMFFSSPFNQPLFHLKTKNVEDFSLMFALTPFDQDIQSWDLENGVNFDMMFYMSKFNQSLENFKFKKKEVSLYGFLGNKFYSNKLFSPNLIKDACTYKLFTHSTIKSDISAFREVLSEEDFELMFED